MRAVVKVTSTGDGKEQRHLAECKAEACQWSYANSIRADVQEHARWHRETHRRQDGVS